MFFTSDVSYGQLILVCTLSFVLRTLHVYLKSKVLLQKECKVQSTKYKSSNPSSQQNSNNELDLEVPSQIHSLIEMGNLFSVSVEDECIPPAKLAYPPLRRLAPTRVWDIRIHI